MPAVPGRTPSRRCPAPTVPRRSARGPRAARTRCVHARPRRRVRGRARARASRASRRGRRAAGGSLRVLDRPQHALPRREARASGWFARAPAARAATERLRRARLPAHPDMAGQMGAATTRPRYATAAEAAAIGERFGDADLLWLARDDQGRALVRQGRVERGPSAGRRGAGGGHGRRAVADRHRHRLLQHDRVLPGRVRAAARARVDRGADAMVRAPARDGRPQRPLPRPPRGDHAAAGRVDGCPGGGAAGGRALHARAS